MVGGSGVGWGGGQPTVQQQQQDKGGFDAAGLAASSPGVALQRGLLSLSHEVGIINPFKSPWPLPPGCRGGGWARASWLHGLTVSRAPVLLSDLCGLRTHHPLPRGMRPSCWQRRDRLASGLRCGEGAALVLLLRLLSSARGFLGIPCHTEAQARSPQANPGQLRPV